MTEQTIVAVLKFPAVWPPNRDLLLHRQDLAGKDVALIGDTAGRLVVRIADSKVARTVRFQRLEITGPARAVIVLTWTDEGVEVRVSGRRLLAENESRGAALRLSAPDEGGAPGTILKLDPDSVEDENERFFLNTLNDIQNKLADGSRYAVIRASGLLRQLLIDGDPLVVKVNRPYKEKLTFTVADFKSRPPVEYDARWINLDRESFPNAKTLRVNRSALLKAPCLEVGDKVASVRDVIKACANVKGGIHFGPSGRTKPGQELVLSWDRAVRLLGEEPSVRAIAGLCRVVLRGVRPLVDAIQGRESH